MAQTPEGKVKDAVKKLLRKHEVWYFMPVSNGMGAMGIFDIVCCVNGKFLGVECKSDATKKPTPLQTHCAEGVLRSGGVVFLAHADNLTDLEYTINQIKEGTHGATWSSFWPVIG